jgi:uncharacterized protein involved in oxidation of intracellular sulfur
VLILINDAPYGTEKAYNGLRLAMQIRKDYEGTDVGVFLMADAVGCALPNRKTKRILQYWKNFESSFNEGW